MEFIIFRVVGVCERSCSQYQNGVPTAHGATLMPANRALSLCNTRTCNLPREMTWI